ncbi:MAG: hypothetical protein QOJ80_4067 [Mycobacterium sp.]|jgi:AcrR family transcriptional regulator|nr:hypothetical protein [Mycobacterium sp.]
MASLRADAVRNRDRLLTAAAELFTDRGVDVPLDEVARRAGVSIGTLYNHFPNRGALLDAVLPERMAEMGRLAEAALAEPDSWKGFTGFLMGLFAVMAGDRALNDAIARSPIGPVDIAAECGQSGGVLADMLQRAQAAGALRHDFGTPDLATVIWAMSKVIAMADGDDTVWRRHLGFILDGLRARGPEGSGA